jgi:hypothetical protein
MTRGLRWRIFVLQVGLLGIFAFCAGFLVWGNSFVHGMVRDELVAQRITFPPAGSPSFSATEYPTLQQYAGQPVDNGPKAQAYANDFIGHHLQGVAGGKTYSQVSAEFLAGGGTNATLAAQRQTLFMGETLRGLLLNAYGWWQVGQYALYAAIGLTVAAVAVFLALMFEVVLLWRRKVAAAVVRSGGETPAQRLRRSSASTAPATDAVSSR